VISRIITKDVHVEPGTFLDHGQADTSGANDSDRFACDLIAEKRQEWMS